MMSYASSSLDSQGLAGGSGHRHCVSHPVHLPAHRGCPLPWAAGNLAGLSSWQVGTWDLAGVPETLSAIAWNCGAWEPASVCGRLRSEGREGSADCVSLLRKPPPVGALLSSCPRSCTCSSTPRQVLGPLGSHTPGLRPSSWPCTSGGSQCCHSVPFGPRTAVYSCCRGAPCSLLHLDPSTVPRCLGRALHESSAEWLQ